MLKIEWDLSFLLNAKFVWLCVKSCHPERAERRLGKDKYARLASLAEFFFALFPHREACSQASTVKISTDTKGNLAATF